LRSESEDDGIFYCIVSAAIVHELDARTYRHPGCYLGVGYAKGIFSTEAGYADPFASVVEVYYNAQGAPWVAISPSVQFVDNPGGDNAVEDSVVFGLRAQSAF